MKKTVKMLLLTACALLLVAGTVLGTLAYLTDQASVVNTFTVGKVDITLAETDVDNDGKTDLNAYHLLPGQSYQKDPTVTVVEKSEESFVRMILTVHNASAVQAIINNTKNKLTDFADLLGGWDETVWQYEDFTYDATANTIAFEFRYKETVTPTSGPDGDGVLEPLFTTLKVPETLDGSELKALTDGGFKMVVTAHAIQAKGFETAAAPADAAWAAFDKQVKTEATA